MYKIIKKSGELGTETEVETVITCDNKDGAISVAKLIVEKTCLTYLRMGMTITENEVFRIINGNWIVDDVVGYIVVEGKYNNKYKIEFEIIAED